MREANVLDVFTNISMQLLAGKVAAVPGDIRRALDIGKKVIEMVETDKMVLSIEPNDETGKTTISAKFFYGQSNLITKFNSLNSAVLQVKILSSYLMKKEKNL